MARRTEETKKWPSDLLDFIPAVTPTFMAPRHLGPLADLLHRVFAGEQIRACISVPPRHGKTETIIHAIPWLLLRRPDWTVGYISYETNLAQSKSRRARDLAGTVGVNLRKDSQRVGEWRLGEGGGVLATGIGGPLTGHGANLLVVDDPFKNREEAESPTNRQRVHEWFTSTALTRLEPNGSVIVCHARWHADDLIGRLSKEQDVKWEVINLSAIDQEGLALWPERWPADALDDRRRIVGEYDWASLYLGLPRPRGSKMFKPDPAVWEGRPDKPLVYDPAGARIAIGVDPAATAASSADYSVAVVMAARGQGVNQVVDIVDVVRVQVEIPALVRELQRLQEKWKAPIFCEAAGGFKAVPQTLRSLGSRLRIVDVYPTTDKFTRALPLSAAWNDGRVRVPRAAAWLPGFLAEVTDFSGVGDAHDDQVDAASHAFAAVDQQHMPVMRGVVKAPLLPFG